MVERYVYEETLYATEVRIIAGDQLNYLTQMHAQACAPLTIYSTTCAICHSAYHPSSRALAHSCGHSYHTQCGGESPSCVLCTAGGTTKQEKPEDDTQSSDVTPQPAIQLDDTQLEGLRRIRVLISGGSKLQFLENLTNPRRASQSSEGSSQMPIRTSRSLSANQGICHSENFALKLVPPTLDIEASEKW
ncbi:hypothetical protein Pcinc_013597 [Petrolisthes cinctipes]|uniref:RING-type domain-containing protein n=1 Tax=Petrolisthes cinctipes TaxID=88211 RepID=A0AAE1KS59_PETCI|nr:hypothetical protein Pcinc_013597 [Petrolisthes cinctipes]